jgi:hypothetical protein
MTLHDVSNTDYQFLIWLRHFRNGNCRHLNSFPPDITAFSHSPFLFHHPMQLRLNASQLEEKRAHEAAVKEIQDQVEAEEDATKKEVLRVELAAREAKLNSLTERFAKSTLEAAMSGEAPRVSQMRKQQLEAAAAAAPPQAMGQYPGGAVAVHPGGSNYNPRYNPTQQYAGPNQRGGYQQQRGGFEHYNAGGRNYVPRGGRGGRGGGRGGGVPEWAQDEYSAGRGGGGGHRGGFDSSGGYRPAPGGGYGDTSDAGFFDAPSGRGGRGGGGGGGGGGSRGGGGGRGRGGNYYDVFNPTGYGGGGRGVGGEINFDTFAGQDRY